MTRIDLIGWILAFVSLSGAAVFFWREKKVAGFAFVIVFIVVLAGVSEKRVVLRSAMLGLTLERDSDSRLPSK